MSDKKKPWMKTMLVTPKLAEKFLATMGAQRRLSIKNVEMLAAAIMRNEWRLKNDGLAFDENGKLVDGQHRLKAVILAGKAVLMNIFYGLDPAATTMIDSGIRPRSMADRVRMFEPELASYSSSRCAYLNLCAELLAGSYQTIRSMEDFRRWYELCEEGIAWALEVFATKEKDQLRNAAVAGALAFAHPRNRKVVADFGWKLRTGYGLTEETKSEPVYVLRAHLIKTWMKAGNRGGGNGRLVVVRKTLRALRCTIEGTPMKKVVDPMDWKDAEFFREAYKQSDIDACLPTLPGLRFTLEPEPT